jgi:O-methyltransferase
VSLKNYLFARLSSVLGRHTFLTRSLVYRDPSASPLNLRRADYVRYAALELVRHEIESRGLEGAVAELGVYRGDFASQINRAFPKRRFYLFDTFEGFDSRDTGLERSRGFSDGSQDFSNTSVEAVLSKMAYPERCVVRQGYFPGTAVGVDDRFVFVSIDTDLYQPIYEGLRFFHPRLAEGGFIFVHDFNNDFYRGARDAVYQFCNEARCRFVPLPDHSGTAVITR